MWIIPIPGLNLNMVKPAAALKPLEHYACVQSVLGGPKLTDSGIATEPIGLTEAQSRRADLFTTAAVPGRSAAQDVCVASTNAEAARGTQHKQLSIVKSRITDEKSRTFGLKASYITPWSGQRTVDHTQQSPEPYNTQRTLQCAATVSESQLNPFSTDGSTKFKWPFSVEGLP